MVPLMMLFSFFVGLLMQYFQGFLFARLASVVSEGEIFVKHFIFGRVLFLFLNLIPVTDFPFVELSVVVIFIESAHSLIPVVAVVLLGRVLLCGVVGGNWECEEILQ